LPGFPAPAFVWIRGSLQADPGKQVSVESKIAFAWFSWQVRKSMYQAIKQLLTADRARARIATAGRLKTALMKVLVAFAIVFAAALVVTVAVTALWNLAFHGTAAIDWETAFRFAIALGIILPLVEALQRRRR
jgi:hypothetical protein